MVNLPGTALARELMQQSHEESHVTPMTAVIQAARDDALQARRIRSRSRTHSTSYSTDSGWAYESAN